MKKLRLLLLTQLFFELAIGQNNIYPLSGPVSIYDYSPVIVLQRNTDAGGFLQGIQTRLQDGTNNWFFGNMHSSSWIVSKGDYYQGIKMLISENGNVGIGTNIPFARLHIKDPSLVTSFNGDQNSTLRIEAEHSMNHFSLLGFGGWSADYPRNLAQIGARFTDSGSYLYFGTSNNYAAGITNSAVVIDYNGKVGIGTANPFALVQFAGAAQINFPVPGSPNGVVFAISNDDRNYGITMGTAPSGLGWIQQMRMDGNNTIYDLIFQPVGGNVGIGTLTTGDYKLNVSGKIRANEIVVNMNPADFVFDPHYDIPLLSDVEKFIKENRHLPGITSASEIIDKGVEVSEMQSKLLQKIEELTLYIIEQNKRIGFLEDQLGVAK